VTNDIILINVKQKPYAFARLFSDATSIKSNGIIRDIKNQVVRVERSYIEIVLDAFLHAIALLDN